MFKITNIQTRQVETCAHRDELLAIVNEQSVWAEDRNETLILQLEQLAEDGSILDSARLILPLESIVEEALATFGLKKAKKGIGLLARTKVQGAVSPIEQDEGVEEEARPVNMAVEEAKEAPHTASINPVDEKPQSPPKPSQKVPQALQKKVQKEKKPTPSGIGFVWKLLLIGLLITVIGMGTLVYHQVSTIASLSDRIALEETQGKVEVVGRFFIANYYTGNNENLSAFLSEKLQAEGVEAKKGEQIQSTIYESIAESKGVLSVTFVITTSGEGGAIKTTRLTLPFKKSEQSVYGYLLVGQPEFSSFGK